MSFPFRRAKTEPPNHGNQRTQDNKAVRYPQISSNSSMYTAFLLDKPGGSGLGGGGGYRLFTGPDADPPSAPEIPAIGETQDADVESPTPPPSTSVAGAATAVAATCASSLTLTRRHIHMLNIAAAVVHGILFVIIYFETSKKEKRQTWRLKQDRIQVVPKPVGDANPFVKITNDKCSLAKPNIMDWANSPMGALQLWVYPQVMCRASCLSFLAFFH